MLPSDGRGRLRRQMRRPILLALTALGALALAAPGLGSSAPFPEIKLQTRTQLEVIAKSEIVVGIEFRRPAEITVHGTVRVLGGPDRFELERQTKQVGDDGRKFRFELSSSERKIVEAAAEGCNRMPVELVARAPNAVSTFGTSLRRPDGC